MENTDLIGKLIIVGLPILGTVLALIKPIINLNVNIQKLSDAISHLNNDNNAIKADVDKHEATLHDHETRLTVIENRNQ